MKTEEPSTASAQPVDSMIADGVRQYQELQTEMERAVCPAQDVETLATVIPQM